MKLALITVLSLALSSPALASRTFNGTSDFATISGSGTAIDITGQQISIAAWVYFSVVPTAEEEPMAKADTSATQYEIYINASGQPSKTLGIYVRQSTSLAHDVFMNCSSQAIVGWNIIVATYSSVSTNWFVYCQGVQANTSTTGTAATIQSNGDNLLLGKKAASSPTFFGGSLAWVTIWNVQLSAGEATSMLAVCPNRVRPKSIVGIYPLLGISGTSIEPDLSGNILNATLTGTTSNPVNPPCTP